MDPLIDTMAGNYRLVSRLGAGGMGEVFKGVHETIGSKVAIKVLHATAARERSAQERFMLEAKAVNRIDHPGVVKVIDAGRLDNGRPFLVLELLDGHSLHELKKRGKLALDDACRAMIDVLDALAAAHAAGVIHRDLKPANVFRTRDGRTVVLDFGIAKLMDANAPARLTLTGSAVGTPHYMAPEQIRGEQPTPAFDIYAVGVMLFELLCGRRPFDNAGEQTVMQGHLERRPPPPRALEPSIPIAVQDIILKALAKDPARRFASAADMRDALRSALDGAPVMHGASPWARPDPDAVATSPASPRVRVPPPPPTDTPSVVVAVRERSKLRQFALIASGVTLAIVGVILFVFARSQNAPPAKTAAPVITSDAAIEEDPWVADAAAATCAQLVTVAASTELRATLFRRCEEDRWAVSVIDCYIATSTAEQQTACIALLTQTQRQKLDDALAAKQPVVVAKPRRPATTSGSPIKDDADLKNPFEKPNPYTSPRPPYPPKVEKTTLVVESNVPNARVYIDGVRVGTAPWRGLVDAKQVRISVFATGYRNATTLLDVFAGRTNKFQAKLDKTTVSNDTGLERPD